MAPEQLLKIAPSCMQRNAVVYAPILTEEMKSHNISTPLRICHFLAQTLHESGYLNYVEEIASGKAYEGRKDLGNTTPGDGVRFKGRGLIQITGRANYMSISKAFNIDCVNHPELLEQPINAVKSAIWFWNSKGLNKYADADDLFTITRRINGGTNGFADRKQLLINAKLIIK